MVTRDQYRELLKSVRESYREDTIPDEVVDKIVEYAVLLESETDALSKAAERWSVDFSSTKFLTFYNGIELVDRARSLERMAVAMTEDVSGSSHPLGHLIRATMMVIGACLDPSHVGLKGKLMSVASLAYCWAKAL